MEKELAFALAARGIVTREDLAEQAVDDLEDIEGLDQERAAKLIMAARAHWFERPKRTAEHEVRRSMSDVTVAQFADVLKVPVDRLLVQLEEAGIPVKGAEDTISDEAKLELLDLPASKPWSRRPARPRRARSP